ncbi:MAG: DNA repair protein RecN [Clostridia bacterium]|nr:DNA repair protein RecN [Clostridia bacterium]
MINTLHIKNIGIIDDITINLNEGFNVLTGETGAGKTLIIGSLQILAGGRFSKEMIRNGESHSFVEMSIYLPNYGYEEDNVIVSREINIKGKNTCKINGRLVTVNELKTFMNNVIDIHGQNDNQSILDVSTHIELLDEYANKELKLIKEEYKNLYEEYLNIKAELAKNYGDDKEKQRKLDLLNYQVNEIEEAKLKVGEEDELEARRKSIMAAEKIASNLQEAEGQINTNAIDAMNIAIKALEKIESYNEEYSEIANRLKGAYYEVQEAARDLAYLGEDLYFDEDEQTKVEERLDLINSLKRKYGNDISEILEYKEKVNDEIYEIENLEGYIKSLKSKLSKQEELLADLANKMNQIRNKYAKELIKKINKELKELEMKNARFNVRIDFSETNDFNKNGLDKVEFLITTNVGEEEKPLIKIASGGEMSRFMLAIKNVLADVDKIPVIIFDEIDTGISGVAANVTGEKIKQISKTHQVICVTHLASIAAKGDYNYFICKEIENNKTRTKVKQLNEEEVLEEIARISTGNVSEISINHARELRNLSFKEIA